MTKVLPCPVCGSKPDIGECTPFPDAPVPWYANCYGLTPVEHCVGVNGDTEAEVKRLWNIEVINSGAQAQSAPNDANDFVARGEHMLGVTE